MASQMDVICYRLFCFIVKTSKINIASNITSVQFTKWDETKVGYVINFEDGFIQMVVEKPEAGGSATARYYWN